jgi:predicted nucleotidyltransferase component of viral defense system
VTTYEVNITTAHVLRHWPRTQGRDAAVIDIAQDLLLRHLHDEELLSLLAFKGGTALRKLYAGQEGRFSLDLDFSVAEIGTDSETILQLLQDEITGLELGPFTYGIKFKGKRPHLTVASPLGSDDSPLESKLDVNAPPWLEPVTRGWVHMTIHDRYDGPLPEILTLRLEENVAEKIARLNRTTTARDVYDLVWLWKNYRDGDGGGLDYDLIRRLAVLKTWVDTNHVWIDETRWAGHPNKPFVPEKWLKRRDASDFDQEDIGQLSVPAPDLDLLASDMVVGYDFLRALDPDERTVAENLQSDRGLVLRMLAELPDGRLKDRGLR